MLAPVHADNLAEKSSAMLMVKTVVDLPETTYSIETTAEIGFPNVSAEGGYTLSGQSHDIVLPTGVNTSMHYEYDPEELPSGVAITGWAMPYFMSQAEPVAAAISAYTKEHGLSGGLYSYEQRLFIKDNPLPLILSWQVIAFPDGRYMAQNARILSTEPSYIQIEYIPKSVANGLDPALEYADGGKLTYRLLDKNLAPLTADTVIETGGAFDTPQYSGTGPVPAGCSEPDAEGDVYCSQDWGLRCIIDNSSYTDCPTGYPDMMTLIEDMGAISGILDFSRNISPVYDEYEDPPGSGEMVQAARVSIIIDSRSIDEGKNFFFISPGGGRTYVETGSYGITLLNQTDRYLVSIDGTYVMGEQISSLSTSPSYIFSKTVTVPNKCETYRPNFIIDPFDTNEIFEWTNDTVNGLPADRYTSVAGLICK